MIALEIIDFRGTYFLRAGGWSTREDRTHSTPLTNNDS